MFLEATSVSLLPLLSPFWVHHTSYVVNIRVLRQWGRFLGSRVNPIQSGHEVDHQAAPSVLELCEVWVYGSECLQCLFIWHKSIYKNKQTNKWTNAIYRHKTLDSKFKTCIFFTVHMCIYAHIKSKTHMQIYAELTGRYWFNALSLDQIFKLRSNV